MYRLPYINMARILGLSCIFVFFAASYGYARQEAIIGSPHLALSIATHSRIYEFEDDECKFILSKEYSRNTYAHGDRPIKYAYIITARYETSDYTIWTNCDLPEIGEWSVIGHKKGNIKKDISPTFTLFCNKYESNATITHDYTLWLGSDIIPDTERKEIEIYKWGFGHWGNRSSLEDLYQVQFARRTLFEHNGNEASLTIFLSRDVQDDYTQRYQQRYDDVYFYITRHFKNDYYNTVMAYVIPRIYFIKLEKNSIYIDSKKDPDEIRFTLIVQHPLSDDGKSWTYHRLEVLKEWGYQPFITISDLGPVPRSEWEPEWPDPATTPLWVEEPGE